MSGAVTLRPATLADRDAVFDWANDEATRANSFRAEPIPYADHVAWFDRVLASETRRLFIALDDGAALGILRLDDEGEGKAIVSINVAPAVRGRGVGLQILRAADDQARADGFGLLEAFIRPANGASHSIFRRAGYQLVERTLIAGEDADRYERALGGEET